MPNPPATHDTPPSAPLTDPIAPGIHGEDQSVTHFKEGECFCSDAGNSMPPPPVMKHGIE